MAKRSVSPYWPMPRQLLERTDITFATKCLVAILRDLPPQADDLVRVSLRRLAGWMGASRATVVRARREAVVRSLIAIEQQAGRRSAYRLLLPPALDHGQGPGPPLTKKGYQSDTGNRSQSATGGVSKCNGRGVKMTPPLARTSLLTPLPTQRAREREEIPPLVWARAVERLKAAYAEAFGAAGSPPSRWYQLLAEELVCGNVGLIDELDAAAMLGGVRLACQAKRPFGFRWVVLVIQQRTIAAVARSRAAARAQSPQRQEQQEDDTRQAEDLSSAIQAHFGTLSAEQQTIFMTAAEGERFIPARPGLRERVIRLRAMQLAWADGQEQTTESEGTARP